ncbi:MAG TPA: PAS domain-containing protein, partial [bacterium]|nr:PAS domain-containing protein [bacterium]
MNKKMIDSLRRPDDLRRQAEGIARGKAPQLSENLDKLLPQEQRKLLYELRVHQIELEMQNKSLRKTQGELESSQLRYFNLYDLAPVGYFTLTEEGLILKANLTARSLLGVERSVLLKKSLTRFIFREDQDIYYHHLKQLFETGTPQVCDLRLVKKDGSLFWGQLESTIAEEGESGDALCYTVISDITERKKAEKALAESEERYRTVFENTGTATVIIEEDMTISMANNQTGKLSGYSKDEIENKMKWTDFVVPEDLERIGKYHIARREAGEPPPTKYEFRMKNKKGNIKDILLKIGMIPDTKKSVASLIDITELRQAEERIKHLNLVLRAIRKVNQLIVKEKNRERLLKGACNNLIKT